MQVNATFKMPGWRDSTVIFNDFKDHQAIRVHWRITALFLSCLGKVVTVKTKHGNLYLNKASLEEWKEHHRVQEAVKHDNGALIINKAHAIVSSMHAQETLNAKNYPATLVSLKKSAALLNVDAADLVALEKRYIEEKAVRAGLVELKKSYDGLWQYRNDKYKRTTELLILYKAVIDEIEQDNRVPGTLSEKSFKWLSEKGFKWLDADDVTKPFAAESAARKVAEVYAARMQEKALFERLGTSMFWDVSKVRDEEEEAAKQAVADAYTRFEKIMLSGQAPDTVQATAYLTEAEKADIRGYEKQKIEHCLELARAVAQVNSDELFIQKTDEQLLQDVDKIGALKTRLEQRLKDGGVRADLFFSELATAVLDFCAHYNKDVRDRAFGEMQMILEISNEVGGFRTRLAVFGIMKANNLMRIDEVFARRYVLYLYAQRQQKFEEWMKPVEQGFAKDQQADEALAKEDYEKALELLNAALKGQYPTTKNYLNDRIRAVTYLQQWARKIHLTTHDLESEAKGFQEALGKELPAVDEKYRDRIKALIEPKLAEKTPLVESNSEDSLSNPQGLCQKAALPQLFDEMCKRQQLHDTVLKNRLLLAKIPFLALHLKMEDKALEELNAGNLAGALTALEAASPLIEEQRRLDGLSAWVKSMESATRQNVPDQIKVLLAQCRVNLQNIQGDQSSKVKELLDYLDSAVNFDELAPKCAAIPDLGPLVQKLENDLKLLGPNQQQICLRLAVKDILVKLEKIK